MPLTDDQEKSLLLLELGKSGDAATIQLVDLLWEKYADQAAIDPRMRPLFAKRDAILALMGGNADFIDIEEAGVSESGEQVVLNLERLLERVERQITQALSGGPAVGQLATTAPITDTCGTIDPNERAYRGDPLRRWWPVGR